MTINNESFGGSGGTVAFTIISRGADGLELTWKSKGINFRHFYEIEAPEIYRQAIRDAVSAATGLPVK